MHQVHVALFVPGAPPGEVFDSLSDFASFPRYTDVVHSVLLEESADGDQNSPSDPDSSSDRISSWEVDFAGGILKWRERDRLDEQRLRIEFELIDGDLLDLAGHWSVAPLGEGSTVRFDARFDLGVPGMADLLEPVAGRAMTSTVSEMLRGVFGPSADVTACGDMPHAASGG
ncbi:type II toxin-antitoxin system RatA family toxin [Streptomyces sp. NPDC021100]|uniref:type II toxin-antitoxin system RatA family toxin n=1 Tax=Streptomyces sp. NPDC021100 TaxID=3365114 RepID=UPI0037AB3F21